MPLGFWTFIGAVLSAACGAGATAISVWLDFYGPHASPPHMYPFDITLGNTAVVAGIACLLPGAIVGYSAGSIVHTVQAYRQRKAAEKAACEEPTDSSKIWPPPPTGERGTRYNDGQD